MIGAFHARWMYLDDSMGSLAIARPFQVALALFSSLSSTPASDEAKRISSCSRSVAAAEAIKAEDASEHALLTPRPTIWTGSEACIHYRSDSWTLRIISSPVLNTLSNSCGRGFPAHGDVLRVYKNVGMAMEFLRRQRDSWDVRRDQRLIDFSRVATLSFNSKYANRKLTCDIIFVLIEMIALPVTIYETIKFNLSKEIRIVFVWYS